MCGRRAKNIPNPVEPQERFRLWSHKTVNDPGEKKRMVLLWDFPKKGKERKYLKKNKKKVFGKGKVTGERGGKKEARQTQSIIHVSHPPPFS